MYDKLPLEILESSASCSMYCLQSRVPEEHAHMYFIMNIYDTLSHDMSLNPDNALCFGLISLPDFNTIHVLFRFLVSLSMDIR